MYTVLARTKNELITTLLLFLTDEDIRHSLKERDAVPYIVEQF